MNPVLTADDLWPLVQKLSRDEQVRLARLALCAAGAAGDAARDESGLDWDAEGWEDLDPKR